MDNENLGGECLGGEWQWLSIPATFEVEADCVSQETIDLLYGDTKSPTGYSLQLQVPTTDAEGNPRQTDIILYKVQFQPLKFDYWNKWYKKLSVFLFGNRFSYWLFYRNALTLNYSGKALISDGSE